MSSSATASQTDSQHRLARIQVYNWGTFSGYHDLPVPRDGLLLTGPSGSGKSSLLDALSAVLVPPRNLRFNAAAQDSTTGDHSRSVLSYVRGAYRRSADEITGEVVTDYLRSGATRSGVALTFTRLDPGETITLVKLFHARQGSTSANSVSQTQLLVEGDIALTGLMEYLTNGIDRQALSRDLEGRAARFERYEAFAARFRRRLGLSGEVAQRLLHRTQSAKNLTSLDALLRDFMLDEPDTFAMADAAVEQFAELREAHAAVVEARNQEALLSPLRQLDERITEARQAQERAEGLRAAIDPYLDRLKTSLHEQTVDTARRALDRLADELTAARRAEQDARREREAAHLALAGGLGQDLPALDARLEAAHQATERAAGARRFLDAQLDILGATAPSEGAAFAELQRTAAQEIRRAESVESEQDGARNALRAEQVALAEQQRELRQRADQITRSHSAMSAELLRARDVVARAVGQAPAALPFAGEVLEVVPGQEEWRVAIETVVGPFARTMLVPEHLYRKVAEAVDAEHLGARLGYERMSPGRRSTRALPADALARRVRSRAGSEYGGWLDVEIMRRFDHACVESARDLVAVDRGVTRAGQVKSSRTSHLKDDRQDLTDPGSWTVGVDPAERLEQVVAESRRVAARLEAVDGEITTLDRVRAVGRERRDACRRILETTWEEVDVDGARSREADLTAQRARAATALPGLGELESRAAAAGLAEDKARSTVLRLAGEEQVQRARLEDARAALAELAQRRREREEDRAHPDAGGSDGAGRGDTNDRTGGTDTDRTDRGAGSGASGSRRPAFTRTEREALFGELEQRFRSRRRHAGLAEADATAREVEQEIARDHQRAAQAESRGVGEARAIMVRFSERWPVHGREVRPEAAFLGDYLELLDHLQADGLPRFERRFAELLHSQTEQNIGQLASEVRRAVSQVRGRIGPVNDALRATEYSPGHHLHIEVAERRLPIVHDFLVDLATIAASNLDLAEETAEEAEARFAVLDSVMTRLGSSDPRDETWRRQCLDTRLHVSFTAVERDESGTAVDYYEGAAGLSGGQRQKLVVFCLAAALRYQLTEPGRAVPGYALVVLDEAFDKTDAEFTRAGLDVFRGFGFQLLLATPMKMLQTLEDHVGGAAMVTNTPEGDDSRLAVVIFEERDGSAAPPRAHEAADASGSRARGGAEAVDAPRTVRASGRRAAAAAARPRAADVAPPAPSDAASPADADEPAGTTGIVSTATGVAGAAGARHAAGATAPDGAPDGSETVDAPNDAEAGDAPASAGTP